MARAAVKYAFAALLALLSTQGVLPSARVVAAAQILWIAEAREQVPETVRPAPPQIEVRQAPLLSYRSRIKPEPDAPVLFQRPPPSASLFT